MHSKSVFFGTLTAIFLVIVSLTAISIRTLLTPASDEQAVAFTRAPSGVTSEAVRDGTAAPRTETAEFSYKEPVAASLSDAVRDMPPLTEAEIIARRPIERELNPRQNKEVFLLGNVELPDGAVDPLVATGAQGENAARGGALNFEGISYEQGGIGYPPDPTGDVGPNHYFQSVNASFRIWDKNGTPLTGVIDNQQIWQGAGGHCEAHNDGDPIVLYDQMADRWFFSQFVAEPGEFALCVAISTTADPLGQYYRYEFPYDQIPDYPKYGIWHDAYYMAANFLEDGYGAYALDRTQMLAGQPTGLIGIMGETNFLMPVDFDGFTPAPPDSPGLFYTVKDDTFFRHGGGVDRLELFEFRPNFTTPESSTFTRSAVIPVTPFTYTVCGFYVAICIPQPGTTERVDPVSEWPMFRFAYRNMGSYQTLVGNFTVDVGSDRAGIRWFELRKPGASWTLHQEGTYAPGSSDHRWMGSIAMDRQGNIAMGYSIGSASRYPSIAYTSRLANDPLGQLRGETMMHVGTGTASYSRWGDYTHLSVDPSDDCTFWYTNQYYSAGETKGWRTRIGTFTIPGCSSQMLLTLVYAGSGTPVPFPIVNGDFELGANVGWLEASAQGQALVVTEGPSRSGSWKAWLGGTEDEVSTISQSVTVPASAPYLSYWRYKASQETAGCIYDLATVTVNGNVVESYGLCESQNTTGYERASINLSAYAGQTVTLTFSVTTDSSINSNLFIEDVAFATSYSDDATFIPIPDQEWLK